MEDNKLSLKAKLDILEGFSVLKDSENNVVSNFDAREKF